MRKIVIPTDFSEHSLHAARYTLELFKYFRCEVFILHTYADEVYDDQTKMTSTVLEKVKGEVKAATDVALETFREQLIDYFHNPKHAILTLSSFSALVDGVNDLVEKENIDLVAMGSRGAGNNKKMTFGSNTLQVIKYVKCPVLAVPEGFHGYYPQNILFSTDYMLPYQRRELKLIATMAERVCAKITCLYITEKKGLSNRQEDNRDLLKYYFNQLNAGFVESKGKQITATINDYVLKHKIDMLIMINSRHSYLENILYTSAIEKIGLHIKIPFLVLQNLPRD